MTQSQAPLTLGRVAPNLPVRDVAESARRYEMAFGLQVTFQNGDPVIFAILKRDAAELHLSVTDGPTGGDHIGAHLMVSDADVAFARCQAAGFKIIKPIKTQNYGLRDFVVADLDGNRIDVGQAL
ncbi:MAG: VOC family protein [Pseudomonadota bacterium]